MTLQKLKEQVLRGSRISKEEAEWLAVQPDKEALYEAAHEITGLGLGGSTCAPSLMPSPDVPGKLQSGVHSRRTTKPRQTCTTWWTKKNACGMPGIMKPRAWRFSLVTSGRKPSSETWRNCGNRRHMRRHSSIQLCASLGLLNERDAGTARRRHHPLSLQPGTAPSYFSPNCTARRKRSCAPCKPPAM